jgi:ABC-type uncharacterized transport system substrate-binding protein
MALLAALPALLAPARADVTEKDIQVAGRVIGFINPPASGTLKIGIVYDASNAASSADEQALMGILGRGLTIAGVTLIPEPVPIAALAGTDAGLLFLTSGLGAAGMEVGNAANAKKILCITTDPAAVQEGACAVAVQTSPSVQIIVNKALLAASGISFDAVFLLMVTEI